MKNTLTFLAVIAWFIFITIAAIWCDSDYDKQLEAIQAPKAQSIHQIPDLNARPYTDSTGMTYIIYE